MWNSIRFTRIEEATEGTVHSRPVTRMIERKQQPADADYPPPEAQGPIPLSSLHPNVPTSTQHNHHDALYGITRTQRNSGNGRSETELGRVVARPGSAGCALYTPPERGEEKLGRHRGDVGERGGDVERCEGAVEEVGRAT